MFSKIAGILFFSCLSGVAGFSQPWLTGKVLKKGSADIVPGVNLHNLHLGVYNRSDEGGNYRVKALSGDTIVFSSAGYRSDTIIVTNAMIVHEHDVYLVPNIVALPAVEVDPLDKYLSDSARRHEEYAFILDKKHPVKLWNEKRAGDAPGLNFSPIGYFSKAEKQKRRLIKRLQQQEENDRQAYIDTRFSVARIEQLTRLSGDSLQQFMRLYRPGFEFCRNAGSQEMLLYINDRLLLYRQGKSRKPKHH